MSGADYRPQWYQDELNRIEYIRSLDRKRRTWAHPMDWVLAIALIALIALLVLRVL
jgi:hypothetical protein